MKQNTLWKLSVRTSRDAEDAVTELLGKAFCKPATSYSPADSTEVVVSVYLERRSKWFAPRRREVSKALQNLRGLGIAVGPGRISVRRIPPEDWAESWKLHFKPLVIGSALLLKPSWSRRQPRAGQEAVILDPGLSFGTGHHPTTSFCLAQLAAQRKKGGKLQSCLDIGTGSGILAIAAAKLGYHPVEAFDSDPESIRVARANARTNGVARKIGLRQQDLTRLPPRSDRKYTLICANLVTNLLLAERERILNRLDRQGVLLVAGILKDEFRRVQKAFEGAGTRLITTHTKDEWRSGVFSWRCQVSPPPCRP